jgi:predicted GNAT family N-acyltransferase
MPSGARWRAGQILWQAVLVSVASYQVRRARSADEMAAAVALRHEVFCVEQGVPEWEELDGRDQDGIHLVAVAEGELLGTCRLVRIGRTIQFSRLAVRSDARRHGIATALLALADREAQALGAKRLVLHAQTYALQLYENAGYRPRGRVFVEAGIEHVAMEKPVG